MTSKPTVLLRIGELARRSGVSAKALRLYEARGLLRPCSHSAAGYRLYGPPALAALMQIVALRRSGFSLAEIAQLLERRPGVASELLQRRIDTLQREIDHKAQALDALRGVLQRVGDVGPESSQTLSTDLLLETIAMTQTLDIDLTPAERAAFLERARQLGEQGLQDAQRAWPELIAAVRGAMQAGTPPTDAQVVELGRRWHALVQAASGGDAQLNRKLADAYQAQPQAMAAQGMDMAMFRYIGQAMAAAGLSLFGGAAPG